MKVGYIQTNPVFGEKEKNFAGILNLIDGQKADLLVLPELFATGYAFSSMLEVEQLAEGVADRTSDFLKELSFLTNAIIVGGFLERNKDNFFNSCMMVYKTEIIGIYRKIHLFNEEKVWFKPGDYQPVVTTVNGVKIGMMICYDWIYPEVCRILALKGAQVVAHPSNLVMPYCQRAMVTRSVENRIFSVTANRIGEEKRVGRAFHFTGGSQITSVTGDILSTAPADKPFAEIIEINPDMANDKKVNDFNDLFADRRPFFYAGLA